MKLYCKTVKMLNLYETRASSFPVHFMSTVSPCSKVLLGATETVGL